MERSERSRYARGCFSYFFSFTFLGESVKVSLYPVMVTESDSINNKSYRMTQKQVVAAIASIGVIAFVLLVISQNVDDRSVVNPGGSVAQKMSPTESVKSTPVPDTVDGITGDIKSQTSADATAFDEESATSLDQINQDSDSVNNLGTSYDENNL